MFGRESLERSYRGYVVEGSAEAVEPGSNLWFAAATVLLNKPDSSVLSVYRFRDPVLAYEDGTLAAWFGLGIAEIAVDECLPPPSHYLTPMDVARAIEILSHGAEDHHKREIRRPPLYEALTFLDHFLERKNWLVRRYRNALRGDTRNQRERMVQREALRVAFRGIQQACVEIILAEINNLALHYRENKPAIDKLLQQLPVVRRPVGK
jgi:hypothetical protein